MCVLVLPEDGPPALGQRLAVLGVAPAMGDRVETTVLSPAESASFWGTVPAPRERDGHSWRAV